jgi:pimeloyl-ACP methyl ester carboxylesterase
MIEGVDELRLRHGDLSFTAWSMGHGPLVLLLHGFPDTPVTFRHQLPAIAAAGYRAVAVRARGYEPSSQPTDGSYYVQDLARDVIAWVSELDAGKAHLVGHDWGATVAFAAAALEPGALRSLTVIAVPQPRRFSEVLMSDPAQIARSGYMMFFQQVGVAEAAVAADDFALLEDLWHKWSPGWEFGAQDIADLKRCFREPGVIQAALTYYRHAFDTSSPAGQASRASFATPIRVPTLGIYGADDGCIGADVFEKAMQREDFAQGMELFRVEGAGHFCHVEQPMGVNARLLEFLGRCE